MKKLGFGTMRLPLLNPEDNKSVDLEQFKAMVDAYLEAGFTYFDTAYMYHSYQSEIFVREGLVKRHPRESFLLADKLPSMQLKAEGDQERIFAEQLEKCGVDYFDYYLIHCLDVENYEKAKRFDSFAFVSKLKEEGKVRKMGFSFHDTAEVLDGILQDHPEVDFVQIQLNYMDWESESIQSRKCYEVCLKHGKDIIVMEPVKGGMLANVPARVTELMAGAHPDWSPASWAIRFAAGCKNVIMVLSGMSNMEQLQDNMSYMSDFVPLKEAEIDLLWKAVQIIHEDIAVACTACRYCVEGCPKQIEIPKYFALYNALRTSADPSALKAEYTEAIQSYGKASDCIGCRKCVKACPQHIRIPAALKQVAKVFE
ncbi:MAG: aldo/keto reductase [Clostridia bacterium]|nr:aldo/keto reductase [Clostridia bacterium]